MSAKLLALGTSQDAGIPHIGCNCPRCQDAVNNGNCIKRASVAISCGEQLMVIDATPDFSQQISYASMHFGIKRHSNERPLDCILLTHAHFGHISGLFALGLEGCDASTVTVLCSQKTAVFLRKNMPFSQLIKNRNIAISLLTDQKPLTPIEGVVVTPYAVNHRTDYSDTFAFIIESDAKRLLYMPDVDLFTKDDIALIKSVDIAIIDGTFYSEKEVLKRDIKRIPHPPITHTIEQIGKHGNEIYFTHFNHTNAVLGPSVDLEMELCERGFKLLKEGMELEL